MIIAFRRQARRVGRRRPLRRRPLRRGRRPPRRGRGGGEQDDRRAAVRNLAQLVRVRSSHLGFQSRVCVKVFTSDADRTLGRGDAALYALVFKEQQSHWRLLP